VRFVDYKELFASFAIAALCVMCLEVALANTVFRRIP
jgi:hypothetical protein